MRSVRAWLNSLLCVLELHNAIDQYRKRTAQDSVISDVFDGALVKELVAKGTDFLYALLLA